MTGVWLSVQELLNSSSSAKRLSDTLMATVDGIHLDVHQNDSANLAAAFAAELYKAWPAAIYDVHFIDDRADADLIVANIRRANPGLRRIYSPRPRNGSMWAVSIAASDIARGSVDDALAGRRWILVTTPPSTRTLVERIEVVSRAVAHVAAISNGTCAVILDRDVHRNFATDLIRSHITEVVVGKAILGHTDAADAAAAVRRTWKVEP
jgi:hypothetical protein